MESNAFFRWASQGSVDNMKVPNQSRGQGHFKSLGVEHLDAPKFGRPWCAKMGNLFLPSLQSFQGFQIWRAAASADFIKSSLSLKARCRSHITIEKSHYPMLYRYTSLLPMATAGRPCCAWQQQEGFAAAARSSNYPSKTRPPATSNSKSLLLLPAAEKKTSCCCLQQQSLPAVATRGSQKKESLQQLCLMLLLPAAAKPLPLPPAAAKALLLLPAEPF